MKIVKAVIMMALISAVSSAPAFAEGREPEARKAASGHAAEHAVSRPGAVRTVVRPSASPTTMVTARSYNTAHVVAPRGVVVGHAVPRVYAPYHAVAVAPITFYRPYYTFQPHVHVGFGLWVGYPVVYSAPYYVPYYAPYAYPYPYPPAPYPYPPAAYPPYPQPTYPPNQQPGYPPTSVPPASYPAPSGASGTVAVQANMGGLSFQITPQSADVFIDGSLVGTVGQFTPQSQPLGVPAGHHRVEIRSEGFRTMSFDVDIVSGQVLPYQGTMERS